MLVLIRLKPVCDNIHQRTGICAVMNNPFLILAGGGGGGGGQKGSAVLVVALF